MNVQVLSGRCRTTPLSRVTDVCHSRLRFLLRSQRSRPVRDRTRYVVPMLVASDLIRKKMQNVGRPYLLYSIISWTVHGYTVGDVRRSARVITNILSSLGRVCCVTPHGSSVYTGRTPPSLHHIEIRKRASGFMQSHLDPPRHPSALQRAVAPAHAQVLDRALHQMADRALLWGQAWHRQQGASSQR